MSKNDLIQLKAAETCLLKKIPFALFRQPNKNKLHIVISKKEYNKIEFSKIKKDIFIFSPFKENKQLKTIYLKNDYIIKSIKDIDVLKKVKTKKKLNKSSYSNTTKSEYENNFKKYMIAFEKKKVQKAILSRQVIENLEANFNPINFFKKINKVYLSTFNYLFFSPSSGLWIGATPETFLNFKNKMFYTPALAGTLPINTNLQWTEKEITEHEIVCKGIKEVYKKNKLKLIKYEETSELKAAGVKHLITNFTFKQVSKHISLKKIIQDLHPTPAVGGYPKELATELIIKTEKHDREYYTGYLGLIEKNKAQLFVNLRCMKINNNRAFIYVGGGITKESIMENEWQETELKSKTLLNLL